MDNQNPNNYPVYPEQQGDQDYKINHYSLV
jgi:hypothetical protein